MAGNVSICVRAGLPKPRGVPDTERIKDTKTLDYASTPLDANTLLCTVPQSTVIEQHGCQSFGCVWKLRGFGIGAVVRSINLYFLSVFD
jgi:hypothetical protein